MTPRLFTYNQLTPVVQARVLAGLQEGAGEDPALSDHLREVLARELRDFNYPADNFTRVGESFEFYGDLDLQALASRLLDPDAYNLIAPILKNVDGQLSSEPDELNPDQRDWNLTFNYHRVAGAPMGRADILLDAVMADKDVVSTHLGAIAEEELRFMTDPEKLKEFLESDDLARYLEDGTVVVEAAEEHFLG